MHRHCCRVWALPPGTEMKSIVGISKFGRSRRRLPWIVVLKFLSLGAPAINGGGIHSYLETQLWIMGI